MHVALVSKWFKDTEAGGGAVSAALLVRMLREHGHRVDVLCESSGSDDPGVERGPLDPARLALRLRRLKPDVVHAYNLDVAPAAVLAGKAARVPVAATVNGHTAVCLFGDQLHPEKGPCGPCAVGKIRACFSERPDWQVGRRVPALVGVAEVKRRTALLSRADLLHTYSESTREVLVRSGVPAERITVIPNMRDPGYAGESRHGKRFLFVGKLDVPKAPDLFVDALARVLPEHPEWGADVAGGGPLFDVVQEKVKAAGLEDRITLHGFVKPPALRELYTEASALVTPVRWEEPFGRIVLEAAAFGVPTLTSDRGGHPEFAVDGETGRVFPAEDVDALARVLSESATDPVGLKRMGAASRERLARHEPDVVVPQYERAYAGLVHGR